MIDTFTKKFIERVKAEFANIFELPALKMVFLIALLWGSREGFAQSAGFNNTFIVLSLNGGANSFYDLNAATANTDFNNANLGTFAAGSSNLILKGAEHNVFKCGGADLTSTRLYYRIYPTASPSGSYTSQSIGYTSGFNNGCGGQDQVWSNTGLTINLLTGLGTGNYTIEVYSDATITCCGGTAFASNSGNNYKATFTVSSIIWTEAGAATAWYTNTNWTPNTTSAQWLAGSVAEFQNAGTATLAGINMTTAPLSIGAIDITSARTRPLTINNSTTTTGTLTLNGVSLGSNSNVILRNNAASSNLLTIQNGSGTMNVALGNSTTNVIDAASPITISSNISGASRSITKISSGTLTLSGTNTYSGGTIISGGTVSAAAAANLGDATGAITLGSGATSATLSATGSFTRNALNVTTSSTAGVVDVAASQTLTLAALNTLSGTDNTTKFGKSGAGTLTLSGAGSYVGQTQIGQGTVIVSNNAGLGVNNSTSARGIDLGLNVGDVSQANNVSVLATNGITVPQSIYVAPNTTSATRTLGVSGTTSAAGFSNEIFLDGTLTANAGAGNTLTLSGNIINTGGLTVNSGTTLLSGTNTYSGATTISAGTLMLGNASALGSTAAGTSITSGAVLDLNGTNYSNAEALTVNGTGISNGGAIINSSATGATYSGLLTLGSASRIVGGTGTIAISHPGTITGATLGLTLGGAQGGSIASIIGTTTGTLTKQDAGTWTLSGANTYTGSTTISAGTLRLGNASALGTTGAGTSITGGAVLDLNGTNYTNAEALTVNGSGITNSGAIINSSATGATYAGLLTLGSASRIVGGTGTIAISHPGTITGATLGLTLGGAQGGSIASIIGTTTGTLTKQDAGTWTLSGANTYTGLTTISAGTLRLGSATALGTTAAGTSITSGAVLDLNGTNYSNAEALTVNGTGISNGGAITNSSATGATYAGLLTLGSASSIVGSTGTINISNAGTISGPGLGLTLGGASGGTMGSIIGTGTGSLTKEGAGTWTLSQVNTYTGATNINGGTLTCGIASAINSNSSLVFANTSGAIFNLNNLDQTVSSISGGGTTGGNISLGSALLTVSGASNTIYSGALSGTGGRLTKTGTGILTLAGPSNAHTGVTTISGGELCLNPLSNATFASQVVLNAGTLSTTGITATRTWTSSSTLNLNANSTIALGSGDHTLIFANSSGIAWAGSTLTITGWTGTPGSSGTGAKIFFGNSASGLTASQRMKISFSGFSGIPILLPTGELVPSSVPNSFVWNGNTDALWTTSSNWTPAGPPAQSDNVTIGGGLNQLSLNQIVDVANLTIDGNFSVGASGTLSVTGSVTYNSGVPTFNCSSTFNVVGVGSTLIPALSYGNLNISGGPRVLASSGTINVCGTFTPSTAQTVTGSTLTLNGAVANTLPTSTYNNLNITGGASGTVTLAAGAILTIDGNLSVSNNTTLDMSNSATGGTINLAGNLNLTNGTILKSGASTNSVFNFMNSTGIQTISQSGGSVNLTGITMNVGTLTSTNTVQLQSDFQIVATSPANPIGSLRVRTNASLDFSIRSISNTSTAGFVTEANSNLITASTEPLGAFNTPSGPGSVQTTGPRTFNATTNYVFNGSSNQYIGSNITPTTFPAFNFPATIGNLTINTSANARVILNTGYLIDVNGRHQPQSITLGTEASPRVLTLANGVLQLETGYIYVHNDVQGAPFGVNNMIVTNQGSVFPQRNPGQFRRYFPSTTGTSRSVTTLIPLGDVTGTPEYTPVVANLSYWVKTGQTVNIPYLGFKCIDGRNPYDASITDYMTRYWMVTTGSSFKAIDTDSSILTIKCKYQNADVVGNEAALKMNRFSTSTLQNSEDISSYTDPSNDTLFSARLRYVPSIATLEHMFFDHDLFARKTVPLYYKTSASGKWQDVNNWLISSDPNFISPAGIVPPIPPSSANSDSIAIQAAHTITADTLFPPYSMDQVLIAGTLNVDSGATMYYSNGPASLDVNVTGTLKIAGTSGQFSGSVLRFGPSALYHHATRGNVSGLGVVSASVLPIGTWVSGSLCRVTGIRDYSLTPASLNQAFSDFTWDCPRQAFNYNALGNLANVTGNLNIINTNGRLFSLTRTQPMAMTVGQNFNISGGNVLAVSGVTTGAASVAVTGNLNISGGSMIMADSAATTNAISASVTGNLAVSGTGSLILTESGASGSSSPTISVTGTSTFSSSSANALAVSRGAKAAIFNANGGFIQSAGTISLVASSGNGTLNIPDNQTIALNGGTFLGGSGAPGSVGTLNVGTNSSVATNATLTLGGTTLRLAASSTGNLNLYGDLNLNSGNIDRTGGSATVNFFATGTNVGSPKSQTISQSSGTITGTIAFNVGSSLTFTRLLLGSDVNFGSGSTINVFGSTTANFAYLDFGPYVLSGQNFTQQNFATLATANANGFWTIANGLTTGALQTTNTRNLSIAGNFSYNGSSPQVTGDALSTCLSLSVMNTSGLSLSTNLTINGIVYLDYFGQHGKLNLGNFNLVLNSGASFSGQSSVDYVVTNGSGYLSMPVSTSAVTYPVGNSTYNPITLTPGAGASVPYRVRVIDGVSTPSPNDGSMLINRYWNVTAPTAPSNTITVVPQWSTGDENAGFAGGSQVKVGFYGTVWTESNASQLGSNPYTSSASFAISNTNLNSGVFFGIGKDNGFLNSIVTYTWNGSSSSSWTVPANWTPGTSAAGPLATDNVIISSPGSNLLSITGSQSVSDFTLSGTGDFTIASGGSLNVTGAISNSSSATPSLDCNSTFLISSAVSQTIPAFNFGNLNASGGDRVLASSGTIGICGSFTPGAGAYTINGSTVDFNGTGAQTINAFNFHNLSISGARGANNVTLPSGTVGIAGSFSPSASFSGGNYVTTGNTVDFNATGAQTVAAFNYNNLTISGARTTNNVTLVNGGTIGIAGAFNPGATFSTGSFVNTGNTIDFNSSGAQTIPAFGFYNNLSNSNNGARTLANGIIKIAGIYSPTSGAITIGTSTIDFAGAAGQVIPASSYYNITNSSNTDRTLASSGIIDINAGFTPSTGVTTINGSTVRYSSTTTGWALTTFTTNVAGRQYNNLTFAGTGGSWSLNGNTIGVATDLTVTAGTLLVGTSTGAATLNVDGNLLVNGGTLNTTNNATNTGTINLLGNFSVSSGTFTKSGAGIGTVNFIKTSGLQTFSSAGAISNGNIWNLGNGITTNTIQFISSVSASTGVFNVNSGATVDFGTNQLTVSTGTFTLGSGANLITANLNGISTAASNSGSVSRTGGVTANISYSTGANYTYNGSGSQVTGAGFTGANNLTISNASNVTLSAAATVNGTLQFNNGYLDLGSNNLTIGASGSISGAGSGKYVRTAGTGQLRRTVPNNNSAVLFAVGRSAYNPLSLANAVAGTTDVYGVIVADAIAPALNSATKVVNRSWSVSESVAGGSNLQVTAQWNSPSEEAAGFAAATGNQIGLHNGSNWSQVSATQAGSNPFTFTSSSNFTPASLTIAQVFAIGKDDAFICSAVPTISSLSITSGYSGDVITLSGSNLSGLTGATIGGTAATVGSQSGSLANITVLGGSTGTITVSSSPVCSGTSSQTFTYNGYISTASGNWNSGATWRGGNVPVTSVPVTIDNLHTVTLNTDASPSSLIINSGGTYTQNNNVNTMTVGSGLGSVTLNGTMNFTSALVSGSIKLFDAGAFTMGNGSILNHNAGNAWPIWINGAVNIGSGATYNHNAGGSGTAGSATDFIGLSTITINSAANINITNWGVSGQAPPSLPSVTGGQWGNLNINISGPTYSGSWQNSGLVSNATSLSVGGTGSRDFRLTTANSNYTGNFGSINVSGGILSLCSGGSTGTGTIVLNVSGATSISGGVFSVSGSAGSNSANTGTVTANFNGNVNITGGALYGLASNSSAVTYGSGTATLNFNADLAVGPGTLDMAYLPAYITPSTATGPVVVNLKGNLNLAAGGTISSLNSINTGRATASTFNFNKATGSQTFTDAGTISDHAINWLVNGGANTLLLSSAANLGSAATSSFTVNSGSTLDCGANVLSGGGTFTAQSGSTLRLGNANGITASPTASGNIQFGTRSFNAAANYVYSGSVNQSSGNGLPSAITGQLTIANTGSSGNNTVTLTTNNTTVSTLNLSSGLFAAGTGQNINLANAGTVNATGGDFATGASAGSITATGSAVFNGTSNPYNVYANGGVNFGAQTVTIQNGGTFRINSGGFVNTNAPFYAAGSTLEYNTGGSYGRGLEWNAASGRGYPHHVTVRNNTNHQPGANGNAGTVFRMGGDLNIHSGSGMFLDWGGLQTTVNFTVSGSVILDGSLSLSTVSGDLFVGGNWSRTGTFEPRSREVVFNGSAAQTFTGPTGFDFFRIINTSSGLTLNSGLFINQRLQIDDGQIILGNNDITLSGAAFITGGNASDYLVTNGTGAVIQNVSGGDDWYPVGPSTTIFGPVTLNQSGTADNISVRVSTAPAYTNAVNDNSKMVNLEWTINEGTAGGNNLRTIFGWTAGSEAASFDRSAGVYHGNYNSSLSRYLVRVANATSGTGPFYSLSTTSQPYTGSLSSQRFVIGNLAGILPCLQTITTPGDWSSAGTWLDGIVPPAGSNVCIRNAITLSSSVANPDGITLEPGGSLNIANGTTLTLGSPGVITNSTGSFLNMTTGSIAFSGLGVINGSNAIGFNNLELNGNTTLTTTPTINGTLEIKPGGFILSATGPNYGASSTLRYNTGGNYNRSNEWNASSGSGYPASVQVSGGTTLDISTGAAGIRRIAGNMTIDAGSSLTQGSSNQGLIVPGNFTLNGTYSMGSVAGGDLVVTGNWTSGSSAVLNHNNRDIRFDGSGAQTISVANGLQFGFLTVDNSGSGLDLLNPIMVNTFRVNANRTFNLNADKIIISASGNLLNNGIFNANGGTIEFTNGGSFTNNGTFNRGTSTVDFVGSTFVSVVGTVQTNFHNIRLFENGGIDFGSGALRGKVSGTLQLRSGSYVANNAPIYEPGSKLLYSGGGTFTRNVEWDPATLQKVEVSNSTTLSCGTNGSVVHTLADSLIIQTGCSLTLNGVSTPLTVGGHMLNRGTLTLSGTPGGDMNIAGDFINNGTFNANSRLVTFTDTNNAVIGGSSNTSFSLLTINKIPSGTVTVTTPEFTLSRSGGSALRIQGGILDLNGRTLTLGSGANTLRVDAGFAGGQTLRTGGTSIEGFTNFSSDGSNATSLGGKVDFTGTIGSETIPSAITSFQKFWNTGNSQKNIGQNILVSDSVLIADGSTLNFTAGNLSMGVLGNVVNNGTISGPATSKLLLNNTSSQNLSGTGSINVLEIDNPAGVSMAGRPVITSALNLVDGKLNTGSDTIILGSSASISESYSAGSYVLGKVMTSRSVNTAASNFGGLGVELTAGDNLGNVEVIRSSGDAGLITDLPVLGLDTSIRWNWQITPEFQPDSVAPNRSLTLFWPGSEDNNRNISSMQIWKRSTEIDPWIEAGFLQTAGGNSVLRSVVWSDVVGFSQFTAGENDVPLSLDLLSLSARKEKNHARIDWSVSPDASARKYQLEKSVDNGRSYSVIETFNAEEKQSTYVGLDYRFFSDSYYRIRVIKKDGSEDVSRAVFLRAGEASGSYVIVPNPASSGNGIRLQSSVKRPDTEELSVKVYSPDGKVSIQLVASSLEMNRLLQEKSALLPAGVYQLQVQYSSGSETLRFVKE